MSNEDFASAIVEFEEVKKLILRKNSSKDPKKNQSA